MASLDQSLKRMGLDYVDIFYHHRMDPGTPVEESMQALADIVRSGKALYAGVSNYNEEYTREAVRILKELHCPFVVNQRAYSIFDRTIERDGVKQYCKEAGIGIIAFSPLAQGRLTDKYLNGFRKTAGSEDIPVICMSPILQRSFLIKHENSMRLQKCVDRRWHRWHFPGF